MWGLPALFGRLAAFQMLRGAIGLRVPQLPIVTGVADHPVRNDDVLGIYLKAREPPTTKEQKTMSEGGGVAKVREESNRTPFDRFAGRCSDFVSRAPFFTFCVLLVVAWAPTYFLVGNFDTYQLIINTPTTIITFLLVALLQNTQKRGEEAL